MSVGLYMDVHVPQPITDQLRRRGVDVLTAQEDGSDQLEDDQLLARAHELRRVMFTQDIRFKVMAEQWQRTGLAFSGPVFGHPMGGTIGQFVMDLELIAKASEIDDWDCTISHIPYR